MAEGGPDEESGDVMLAGAAATVPTHTPTHTQHQPLNLKAEESDRESSAGSPESASTTAGVLQDSNTNSNNLYQRQQQLLLNAKLNGSMGGITAMQALSPAPGSPVVNAPLNLSVSAAPTPVSCPSGISGSGATQGSMPQLILASGQLGHGVQGAQLLIPTPRGIATQTILAIPVHHHLLDSTISSSNAGIGNNLLNATNHLLSNGTAMASAQQLLNALQQQQQQQQQQSTHPSQQYSPVPQPSLLSTLPQIPTVPQIPQLPQLNQLSQFSQLPQVSQMSQLPQMSVPVTSNSDINAPENLSHRASQQSQHTSENSQVNGLSACTSSPAAAAVAAINRLAAINSEVTVTTSSTLGKPSPQSSPTGTDNSTMDLLVDSPNQPTINQTNSNVVDGINLDEIKEFAKAFKLRRLSLGLTQTQVGQALSITEGPAYSQSAICSALATQMYCAAQLTSHQQAMFEKLDITPKSAQKIKPVLERWMKEAEESALCSRYKSGQNHLTDFIGVEPSKKRKRRTSFTPQALELLNAHFERNTHPSGTEITGLAHQLGYEREVIRIWFCNKRQALKNTVRMMSKGMV